jgi:hypothetical protein
LLEGIVDQFLAIRLEPQRLVLTAYARDSAELEPLHRAASCMVSMINERTSASLSVYSLNLQGYYGKPCEAHRLPVTLSPSLTYILFTDNFNDRVLLGHAHRFLAKSGIPHDKIKAAALIYPSSVHEYLSIETVAQGSTNVLISERLHVRPDFVGRTFSKDDDVNLTCIRLVLENGSLVMTGYQG